MIERPIWETIEGNPMKALVMAGMGLSENEICTALNLKSPTVLTPYLFRAGDQLEGNNPLDTLLKADEQKLLNLDRLVPIDFRWEDIHLTDLEWIAMSELLNERTIGTNLDASQGPAATSFAKLVPTISKPGDYGRRVAAMVRFAVGKRLNAFPEHAVSMEDSQPARRLAAGSDEVPLRRESPSGLLSKKQIEVLQLAALGLEQKQIATRLNISEKTVRLRLSKVNRQLGSSSIRGSLLRALESGQLRPEDVRSPAFNPAAIAQLNKKEIAFFELLTSNFEITIVQATRQASLYKSIIANIFRKLITDDTVSARIPSIIGYYLYKKGYFSPEELRPAEFPVRRKELPEQSQSVGIPQQAVESIRRDRQAESTSLTIMLNPRTPDERVEALKRIIEGKGCALVIDHISPHEREDSSVIHKPRIIAVGGDTVLSLLNTLLELTNKQHAALANFAGVCMFSIANGSTGPFVDIPSHTDSGEKKYIRVHLIEGWNKSPIHKRVMETYRDQLKDEAYQQQAAS